VELQNETIDVKLVVASALEQAQPLIEARSHALVLHLGSTPAFVQGDKTRLVQVLSNLLNNAAKYTPHHGEIVLSLEASEGQVRLRVSDNGSGIALSLLPHVFELFTQAERTPDRAQGGLGMGLALVKHIIALQGGTVEAQSEGLGKGSVFTVTLPLVQQKADSLENLQLAEQAAQAGQLQFMIVDDNRDAGQMLASLLEATGHQVMVREDAESALVDVGTLDIEVFILDIGLPGMDGYELARQLRANPATQHTALVALTGYGQAHDRALAKAAGFDHYFVKPIDMTQLTALLAKLN
jgi:CheY-like chemotaxis protein